MSHSHTKHYVLRDDGSATPRFSVEQKKPLLSQESMESLVLRSGFSSQTESVNYAVSAALQLNGDCTTMDDDSLASFARAELDRHHRISYRTYDVDPDHRVCVVADQASDLDQFIQTYGGLLEIEPLLIGAFAPGYTTVDEIEIRSSSGRGYVLDYTVKSVLNRNRCTYCGLCGRICPVQCISEDLHFDFSICTLCTDCEKQCPEEAIDLHAIERISLKIPALVILGAPQLSLPEKQESIYRLENINDYLTTIFACRVDEVITCDHSLCHYTSSSTTGCKACLGSCSHGAIGIRDNSIEIDPFTCTECGECVSICPTGALQNEKFTDKSFLEFFRTFPLQRNTTVVIGSAAAFNSYWWRNSAPPLEQTCFLEVPEVGALTLLNLLFLIAHGAGRVVLLSSSPSGEVNLNKAVKEANLLSQKSIGLKEPIFVCKPEDLTSLLADNFISQRSATPYTDLSFINRRQKLSSVLNYLSSDSDTDLTVDENEVRFISTILCDDNLCTQCLACLNSCKIESLSADKTSLSLCWNGSLCIGCQSCVEACPEDALSCRDGALLTSEFFNPVEKSRAEPMACESCGKVFGTKKSFEKVMAILAEKQQAPPEHLHYCEDCRVLKLLENQ